MNARQMPVLLLAGLCIAAASVLPAQGAEYLTSTEIIDLISGRTSTFFGSYFGVKFSGSAKWNGNGTLSGRTNILGATHNWTGKWYVRDNLYCRSLTSEGRNDSNCHRVEKIGPRTIRFIRPDGTASSTTIVN